MKNPDVIQFTTMGLPGEERKGSGSVTKELLAREGTIGSTDRF